MALTGNLEEASHERIRGWAFDPDNPGEPVVLIVSADRAPVARLVANVYRGDLHAAGIGDGRHSFDLDRSAFKLPLSSCAVHVRDEVGDALPNSPALVEAPMELNDAARTALLALLDSPASDDDLRSRAAFLAEQTNRLLDRLSARQSNRAARIAARARKWRWRPEDGPEPPRLAPRALVIDSVLPMAGHDAGSNAITSHTLSLQRLGYEVTFAPADMRGGPGAEAMAALGVHAVCEPWCGSIEELIRRQHGLFDLVYFHKLDAAARYIPLVRHAMPKARRIYNVADLHSLRLARQAEVEERPELVAQANYARMLELTAAATCQAVITHSSVEAGLLRHALPNASIEIVPWAVPPTPTPAPFDQRRGMAFVGSFSHGPNLDGAIWLMDEIMPLVWKIDPAICCEIVGSDMPASLPAPRDERIVLRGRVGSIAETLGRVRLTAAPLAFGAGLKGKVADSLAHGVPVVCTPVAAEGFALPAPLRALVAEGAPALAAAIAALHNDAALFQACRAAGLDYVAQTFSEAVVDAGMRRVAGLPASTPAATGAQVATMTR